MTTQLPRTPQAWIFFSLKSQMSSHGCRAHWPLLFDRERHSAGPLLLQLIGCPRQQHDPEEWRPVFPRDKREAFARRSCSNKEIVTRQNGFGRMAPGRKRGGRW